jgi:hypothetical protein
MPRRKREGAVDTSAADPAAAPTASRSPAKTKQAVTRSRPAVTRATASSTAGAEQEASATILPPSITLTAAEAGTENEEALATLPGAPPSRSAAVSTGGLTAVANTVSLDPGLSVVEIGIPPMQPYALGQISLPLIWLSQPVASEQNRVKILTASGRDDDWLPPTGDLIVVRAPATGGQLTVTVFGPPGQPAQAASIAVRRLISAPSAPAGGATPSLTTRNREIRLEMLVHIERRGDQLFPGTGWVGTRGSRLRIEGFVVRPLEELAPSDIEYQILGPDDRLSPWIRSPQFCGARGRRLRVTGFAVRLSPRLRDHAAVEYFGSFFDSGISGPFKNGEVCRPLLPGDTLEAINIRVTQRA